MTTIDTAGRPRPSATLVVVRDGAQGLEVLLSRRAERGDHNSGAWVFPGGLVDAGDRAAHGCCAGLDDAAASARLDVPAHGLDYWIAAVRECFEESGLLFAVDASGALAQRASLKLLTPTQKTLGLLARFPKVAPLLEWAGAPGRRVELTVPRMARSSEGPVPVVPDEPAWAELGKLDPEGRGDAWCEIRPGEAVRLSPRVIRVTADNGSVMTGPGTNTYLVGGGAANQWAVIDPGPRSLGHVEAILAAAPGPIRWVFATHTHVDHSPATAALVERTGARVHGRIAAYPEWQDDTFSPDIALQGRERIALPGDTTLRVIHTPGHASNHLCYLLEEERLLFTGDHLMQLSTVVINPPDGDMAAYLASLRALLEEDVEWLAPGHGFLMAEPRRVIEGVIAHRLKREAKVVDAIRARAPASLEALLPVVYDDVPPRLHPMARRSLTAHLDKLRRDGAAHEDDGRWSLRA